MKTKTPYVKLLRYFYVLLSTIIITGTGLNAQRQNLILESTFDGSNFINGWSNEQHCCNYSITQQSSPTKSGTGSIKFDLYKTDPLVSSSSRTEITQDVDPENIEKWYGLSYFFPSDYGSDVGGESILQWHDVNGTCPPLSIQVWGKSMILMRSIGCVNTQYAIGDIVPNTWIDIVLHVKWSTSGNGILELWRNGTKLVNAQNITTNTSGGSYLKLGMNKWSWAPGGGASNVTHRVFYVDEFRMGNANATYNDVAPSATSVPANQPPVARAGNDINLTLPTIIASLDGSSSTDPDGSVANYSWSRVSGPTGFSLLNPLSAITTVTSLLQGTYVFRLTVTDNKGATATDDVTVTVAGLLNQAPTASAGNDINLTLPNNSTTLAGAGADADGRIASYAWSRVSGPTSFTLGSANTASTTINGLVQGTYVFKLTVTDNVGATASDNITIVVNAAPNQAPGANAGNDVALTLPANSATLNGSGTDIDGSIANYAWTRLSGPTTFNFSDAASAATTVSNLVQGTYVFRLTVTDNKGSTASDNVTVVVNPAINQAPTVNAGNDISISLPVNATTLSGTANDADGSISNYAWSKISGPNGFSLSNPLSVTSALSNLVQGVYVFRLTVTDNSGATASDNVTVTVNAAPNQAPVVATANAINITLPANSASISGIATDADGSVVSYAWSRVSGPTSFTFANGTSATTTASNLVEGTYVFRLTVTDDDGATASDDLTVIVNPAAAIPNQAPVARAGNDIAMTLPTNSTSLNGNGSTDADGNIATYSWTRVSGPATFTIANSAQASTALTNLVQGTYVFKLTITDNNGATASDNVSITVNAAAPPPNQAPVVNAGNNVAITLPVNTVGLNGVAADADGSIATYAWTLVSGPSTFTIANANAAAASLTNLGAGVYVFRLTVTDDKGATTSDDVTITVNAAVAAPNQAPSVNAGNAISITLPANSTSLNGAAIDGDGTITGYSWSKVSGPATFTIVSAGTASTSVTGLIEGVYVFKLTVTDDDGATSSDNISVTVNAAPVPPNQSPIVSLASGLTVTLPTNTAALSGTANDPDGRIATYSWTRVSGPTTFTLTSPGTAATAVTNLVQGVYVFRLAAFDDKGAGAAAQITVTVNAAPIPQVNKLPVATAGPDAEIVLPVSSITLSATGSSDPDGRIVKYEWSQLSGPAQALVADKFALTSSISSLTVGIYVYQLTVTDNSGATAKDTVQILVKTNTTDNLYLNLFPNPAIDKLTVQYFEPITGAVKINIYDSRRMLVRQVEVKKDQVGFKTEIDISRLRPGFYFLQVIKPDRRQMMRKFVKM